MKNDEVRKAPLDGDIYGGAGATRFFAGFFVLGRPDKRGDSVHGISS